MSPHWIPVCFLLGLTVVAATKLYLDYRHKKNVQKTICRALDQGEHLTADVIEKIQASHYDEQLDIRRAVTLFAIGGAILVATSLFDNALVGLAIAIFPLSLSAAFLALWKMRPKPLNA